MTGPVSELSAPALAVVVPVHNETENLAPLIDEINVLAATMTAMGRAVAALRVVPDFALVDGNRLPELPCPARAVVGEGHVFQA